MPEQNNKLKLVRAVMLCVTLAIMAAIFLFSAQPGESSSALSQQITEKVESASFAACVPLFMATPTLACAKAGASFVPSPIMATSLPAACSRRM